MSWSDANDPGWEELDDSGELEPARWPLAPTGTSRNGEPATGISAKTAM